MFFSQGHEKHRGFPVESYRMKFKSELTLCLNIFFSLAQLFLKSGGIVSFLYLFMITGALFNVRRTPEIG